MNTVEILWFTLVRLTTGITIAAVIVQALIWIVRPVSPQTHRIAWGCVLISGMLFARIPINISDEWFRTNASKQLKPNDQSSPNSESGSDALANDLRPELQRSPIAPLGSARDSRMRAAHLGHRIESESAPGPVAVL